MALPCASSESDFMHVPKKMRCSPRLNKGSAPPSLEKSSASHSRKKKCAVKPTARSETFRCNPSRLSSIVALLSPDQKGFVVDAGFGHLLSMQACNIPKGMTVWLIKRHWKLGGKSIPIKPLVEKVIGAPSGPIPVELSRDGDLRLKNKFTVKGRGQPIHITISHILKENTKDEFTISFMLVALCVYLAPMANLSVNRDYLGALSNVKKISDMNWCEHIADFLIQRISDFKTNKKDNVYVRGCVHILNVIFTDCVASYSAPQGIPRILHVTTAHLLVVNLLAVNKSLGQIDYDSLQLEAILDALDKEIISEFQTEIAKLTAGNGLASTSQPVEASRKRDQSEVIFAAGNAATHDAEQGESDKKNSGPKATDSSAPQKNVAHDDQSISEIVAITASAAHDASQIEHMCEKSTEQGMRAACYGNGAEKDEGRRATSDADHTPTEEQFPGASMMDSMTDDTTIDTKEVAQMLETIVIDDSSQESRPAVITVPQLTEPIPDGERFPNPSTAPPATKHRAKRCKSSHTSVEAIAQLGKAKVVHDDFTLKLFQNHVLRTIKGKGDAVKVSIDGAYVTEEEFQSVLKYSGEVDSNFMWVCCKAMMADWDSKNKIIVDVVAVSSNLQLAIDMRRRVEGKDQFGFTIFPATV
uniref:Aminotransferase-like plant mobile domain-containing protein n=1 Tax=Oryza punctata TaxID=4537 RepID=A0A0E0LDP5_ORYPU